MKRALLFLLLAGGPLDAQTTHVLIVSGVGGEPRLVQQFQNDAQTLRAALAQRFGASVTLLTESSTPRSDKPAIAAAFSRLAAETGKDDNALVVFIGHGSAQGGVARINLPGPDITDSDLAAMLNALAGRKTSVVLATSASGAFLPVLEAPNRTVVAATRSGAEDEVVVFPRYFAEAFAQDGADADKDGAVSIGEAFEYARREVARFYKDAGRLATEHAQVSDSVSAGRFLLRGAEAAGSNAELLAIQQRIDALKARKSEMAAAAYDAELEKLLLELARKTRELRAAGKVE